MYRLHFMSNRWLAVKCKDNTLSDIVDNDSSDLENIISAVDEGIPTMLIEHLENLPENINFEIIT